MSMDELEVSAKSVRIIGICVKISKRVIKFNEPLSSVLSPIGRSISIALNIALDSVVEKTLLTRE